MRDQSGTVIYVGKAKNLKRRVSSYFHREFAIPRLRKLVQTVCDISTIRTANEAEALIVESRLIKKLQPFFNVELKIGTRYPSVIVTEEVFPRVVVTRQRTPKDRVFGPYTSAGTLKNVLRLIETSFPLRTCTLDLSKGKTYRPCLRYELGKCLAPCAQKCSLQEYDQLVDDVILLLSGQTADLISRLRQRMDGCAQALDFEQAAQLRDTISNLWRLTRQRVSYTLSDDLDEDNWLALTELQRLAQLPTIPWRIDGFDISHHAGYETYGVAVVFEQGIANPALYRRFKIKSVEGIDDFRSMEETLLRRNRFLLRSESPLPQLILIDGGPEQLAFARKALEAIPLMIPTISLAKREELIFTEPHEEPLRLERNHPALRLLQRIRDESHRYAITTHRRSSEKRFSRSSLESIPGIGRHKAAELLSRLGSVQHIASMEEEQLSAVPGIGPVMAGRIYQTFHGENPVETSQGEEKS